MALVSTKNVMPIRSTHIESRVGSQSRHPRHNQWRPDHDRPQWLSMKHQHVALRLYQELLTEGNRASDFASESVLVAPRRVRVAHDRGHQERIRAERLDLEYLVRILHDLPQANGLLKLLLPLGPGLSRLREDGVQPTQTTIVMNGTRVHET